MATPRATYRLQLAAELRLRRRRGARAVPRRARRQPPVLLAVPAGGAGQRRTATTSSTTAASTRELGGEAGSRAAVRGAARARARADPRHRPEPHGDRHAPATAWWWDVLENGPSSRYARYFDVDWDAERRATACCCRSSATTTARARGAASSRSSGEDGAFVVRYDDHALPVAPRSLGAAAARAPATRDERGELGVPRRRARALPLPTASRSAPARSARHRDKAVLSTQLRAAVRASGPQVAARVDDELAALNADADRARRLLERQNYRLALLATRGDRPRLPPLLRHHHAGRAAHRGRARSSRAATG